MKAQAVSGRLDANIHGDARLGMDGFSVLRLLSRLRRAALNREDLARPRRSIDRQAQEWWLCHD
jgi:hypothetical protein